MENFKVTVMLFLFVILLLVYCSAIKSGYSQLPVNNVSSQIATNSTLRVAVTVFGIDNATEKIVAFVIAKNTTLAKLFDASALDNQDSGVKRNDGIVELYFPFSQLSLAIGKEFKTCVIVLKDLTTMCEVGYKSPSERPEYISLSVKG